MVSLKALADDAEGALGVRKFIGTDVSFVFGLKRNLNKRPRTHASEAGVSETKARYGLGPEGVRQHAKVVRFTPGEVPAERVVVPSCGVMPPVRVSASAPKRSAVGRKIKK